MTGERLRWYKGAWPYEGEGYWFDGLGRLGFALHDKGLIEQARRRLNAVADHMNTRGLLFLWWLDRAKAADRKAVRDALDGWPLWACGLLGRAMAGYYAGSGDRHVPEAMRMAYGADADCLRSITGNLPNVWPAYDTYCWTGDRGVAASAKEKDYVHLVTAALARHTKARLEIMVRNIADFERGYATYDVDAKMRDCFAFDPDLVVLAIGENVPALQTKDAQARFQAQVVSILRCALARRHPLVVVRSSFWPNAAKDAALREACRRAGGIFADAGPIGRDPANAARSERSFQHAGVAAHPGDRGMKALADAIVAAMRKSQPRKGGR